MKPDLSQSDFGRLAQRSTQLARHTRRLFGIEPADDEAGSTPIDWVHQAFWRAFELLAAAVLLVVSVALILCGDATP